MNKMKIKDLIDAFKPNEMTLTRIYKNDQEIYHGRYKNVPTDLYDREISWVDSFGTVLIIDID